MRTRVIKWLASTLIERVAMSRDPDFVIGGQAPYLMRWWVIPRNRVFNVYLHCFLRSDDDRALHDHPWGNASLLLRGEYTEHTIAHGGIHSRHVMRTGDVVMRWSGKYAHRIELHRGSCWTLFFTGPVYRHWGFHCADRWVPHEVFTDSSDPGSIGRGCE